MCDQLLLFWLLKKHCVHSFVLRLSQKRTVQGPKNRRSARNPLKTLAARDDLQSEYTEIKTGIADKELRRIKLESSKYLSSLIFKKKKT